MSSRKWNRVYGKQGLVWLVALAVLVLAAPAMASGLTVVSQGATYTLTPPPASSYPDTNNAEVTDGLYRFAWGDMIGWADSEVNPVAVIDLGKVVDGITHIGAKFMRSGSSAVNMPKGLIISTSNDGVSFTQIAETKAVFPDPAKDESINEIYWETVTPVSARYVKVEINQAGRAWVMLTEIEVATGTVPAYFELSQGKTYTISPDPSANYADSTGTKLTDGDASFAWSAMVGWNSPAENPVIVLDLGSFYENVSYVGLQFMRSDASYVNLPSQVKIQFSNDNQEWYDVHAAQWESGETVNEQINTISWQAGQERELGRYVRIEIVPQGAAWTLLNEIIVGAYRDVSR